MIKFQANQFLRINFFTSVQFTTISCFFLHFSLSLQQKFFLILLFTSSHFDLLYCYSKGIMHIAVSSSTSTVVITWKQHGLHLERHRFLHLSSKNVKGSLILEVYYVRKSRLSCYCFISLTVAPGWPKGLRKCYKYLSQTQKSPSQSQGFPYVKGVFSVWFGPRVMFQNRVFSCHYTSHM